MAGGTVVRARWRSQRRVLAIVALLMAGMAAMGAAPAAHVPHARAAGQTVHYKAGWSLVSAPSGSDLGALSGSLYALGPATDSYQHVAPADVIGGRGYWAYFSQDTDVTLDATAAAYTRMILPADRYAVIGNPSSTQTLPISGADVAFAYDSTLGYTQVSELQPGQAAFVLSNAGADVSVGKPTSQTAADQIRVLQAGLTQDAADLSNFGKLPGVAEQFLNARDYAMVQTAMDDTRAAFGDGLVIEHAAAQPTLTVVQHESEVEVRQAIAQAQTDASTGNSAGADQMITAAKKAAQDAEDDAAAVARNAAGSGQSLPQFEGLAATPAYTPGSLARYGNLCNATVLALAMNLPPSDAFVGLVLAVLNNQPLPPAGGQPANTAPASPTPGTPTPVAPAGAPPASAPSNCRGQLSLQPSAGSTGSNLAISFMASGLDPNSAFSIFFNGLLYSVANANGASLPAATDAQGGLNFTANLIVPGASGQTPVVVATANRCAQVLFLVLPQVVRGTPSPCNTSNCMMTPTPSPSLTPSPSPTPVPG